MSASVCTAWILVAGLAAEDQHRAARREARGVSAIVGLPDNECVTEIWEAECTREILRQAIRALREETRIDNHTIRAFELLAFQGLAPSEVAARPDSADRGRRKQ